MTLEGVETPTPDQPPLLHTYDENGLITLIKGEHTGPAAYRQANLLSQVVQPPGPVKVGDTWSKQVVGNAALGTVNIKIEESVIGPDKFGNISTIKIKRIATEASGEHPAKVEEDLWMRLDDFSLVKSESKWTNLPLEGSSILMSGKMVQVLKVEGQ